MSEYINLDEPHVRIVPDALHIVREIETAQEDSINSVEDVAADTMRPTQEIEEIHRKNEGRPLLLGRALMRNAVRTNKSRDLLAVREYALSLRDKQQSKFETFVNLNRYTKAQFHMIDETDVSILRELRDQYHGWIDRREMNYMNKSLDVARLTETPEDFSVVRGHIEQFVDPANQEDAHWRRKEDLIEDIFPAVDALYEYTQNEDDFMLIVQAVAQFPEFSTADGMATKVYTRLFELSLKAGQYEIAQFSAERIYNDNDREEALQRLNRQQQPLQ